LRYEKTLNAVFIASLSQHRFRQRRVALAVSDPVNVADSLIHKKAVAASLADVLSVGDAVEAVKMSIITIGDVVNILDWLPSYTDVYYLGIYGVQTYRFLTFRDSVHISDATTAVGRSAVVFRDQIGIYDGLGAYGALNTVMFRDEAVLTDSVNASKTAGFVVFGDGISVRDSLSRI